MSTIAVSGDLKYLLFVFLGIMVAILVLGYHKSPVANPQLGQVQRMRTNPTINPQLQTISMPTVSTGAYVENQY